MKEELGSPFPQWYDEMLAATVWRAVMPSNHCLDQRHCLFKCHIRLSTAELNPIRGLIITK